MCAACNGAPAAGAAPIFPVLAGPCCVLPNLLAGARGPLVDEEEKALRLREAREAEAEAQLQVRRPEQAHMCWQALALGVSEG